MKITGYIWSLFVLFAINVPDCPTASRGVFEDHSESNILKHIFFFGANMCFAPNVNRTGS